VATRRAGSPDSWEVASVPAEGSASSRSSTHSTGTGNALAPPRASRAARAVITHETPAWEIWAARPAAPVRGFRLTLARPMAARARLTWAPAAPGGSNTPTGAMPTDPPPGRAPEGSRPARRAARLETPWDSSPKVRRAPRESNRATSPDRALATRRKAAARSSGWPLGSGSIGNMFVESPGRGVLGPACRGIARVAPCFHRSHRQPGRSDRGAGRAAGGHRA
jgi:hypothetical protein